MEFYICVMKRFVVKWRFSYNKMFLIRMSWSWMLRWCGWVNLLNVRSTSSFINRYRQVCVRLITDTIWTTDTCLAYNRFFKNIPCGCCRSTYSAHKQCWNNGNVTKCCTFYYEKLSVQLVQGLLARDIALC